jgi:toxin ParE1/3/4
MATVQITKTAYKDLKEIFKYISKRSYQNAETVILKIKDEVKRLEKQPEIGQIVREIDDPAFREIKVFKFRIIYVYNDNLVSVITIHHSSRLLSNNPHIGNFFE